MIVCSAWWTRGKFHKTASFDNLQFPHRCLVPLSIPIIRRCSSKSPKCVAFQLVEDSPTFPADVGKKVGRSACEVKRHHLESKEWSSLGRNGRMGEWRPQILLLNFWGWFLCGSPKRKVGKSWKVCSMINARSGGRSRLYIHCMWRLRSCYKAHSYQKWDYVVIVTRCKVAS